MSRELFAAWLWGVCCALAWAWTLPVANDWDPAYYRVVAHHLLAGDGAVLGALWTVAWLPPSLPYAADLHWMPIPSRVLVPGLWLSERGDQGITAALAGCWAPLAWVASQRMGAGVAERRLAALLTGTGLAYGRFLGTPDSIAVYGAIGGLAVLGADGPPGRVALLAALAAWTRNDGFLLGLALSLARADRWRWGIAASGVGAAALWHARNQALVGPGYAALRAATARVTDVADLSDLVLGNAPPLSVVDRLAYLVGDGAAAPLGVWLFVLPLPAAWWWFRGEAWLRPVKAWVALGPIALVLLAPGVATSGSVFRSAAPFFPVAVAASLRGLAGIGQWSWRLRGYHPLFLPVLLGAGVYGIPLGLSLASIADPPLLAGDVCARLAPVPAGAPVFSALPLLLEDRCGRPGVALIAPMSAEQVETLASRYNVSWALLDRAGEGYGASAHAADAPRLLPGWEPVGSDGLWRRPASEDRGPPR